MNDVLIAVSTTLKQTRTEQGLTLDEAARLTGVSKAMLGQIERGESTPTISTLWKISTGLKIPFSKFLKPTAPDRLTIDINNLEPVYASDDNMLLYNVFPFDPLTGFEYFYIKLLPGAHHVSAAHKAATTEYVVVTLGTLELKINETVYELNAPAALSFQADVYHEYNNPYTETVVFQNIVRY